MRTRIKIGYWEDSLKPDERKTSMRTRIKMEDFEERRKKSIRIRITKKNLLKNIGEV